MRLNLVSCLCLERGGLISLSIYCPTWPANINRSGLELKLIGEGCFYDNRPRQTNLNTASTDLVVSQEARTALERQALHCKGLEFEQEQLCEDPALPKRLTLRLKQRQQLDALPLICTTL